MRSTALVPRSTARQPLIVAPNSPLARRSLPRLLILTLLVVGFFSENPAPGFQRAPAKRATEKQSKTVHVLTPYLCSSVASGLDYYRDWLAHPLPQRLEPIMRQYGGEIVNPALPLQFDSRESELILVRMPESNLLCYLPADVVASPNASQP